MNNPDIPKMEANSKEMRTIEYVAGLDARLSLNGKYLEKRLKTVPDLWRQWRIAQVATEKVLDGLYDTLEPKAMHRIRRLCDQGEVYFRFDNILNKTTDTQLILTEDLKVLINAAMSSSCAMCMKEGREIKRCELRKALMNISPPNILGGSSRCDFADVASNCDLGDYI